MTDYELRKLAHYIVIEMGDQLGDKILKTKKREAKRLVSAKTAAEMLGISRSQLYHIKDEFTYVKGVNKNSPIRFNEATLADEYEQHLRRLRN